MGTLLGLHPSLSLESGNPRQAKLVKDILYLPSLKLTANAPENRPGPKRKRESIPNIHVGVQFVRFREGIYLATHSVL